MCRQSQQPGPVTTWLVPATWTRSWQRQLCLPSPCGPDRIGRPDFLAALPSDCDSSESARSVAPIADVTVRILHHFLTGLASTHNLYLKACGPPGPPALPVRCWPAEGP